MQGFKILNHYCGVVALRLRVRGLIFVVVRFPDLGYRLVVE
jgi:hypothetical protein